MYVYVCGHAHMITDAYGVQKRVSDPLGLGVTGGCEMSNVGAGSQT